MARALVRLAGTPDDASDVDTQLVRLAALAAAGLPAVTYASTTTLRADGYTTVAASSALASAVDDAQYAAGTGPCLEALATGTPVTVGHVTTTMKWPGFREAAHRFGLRSSLSIPLFAGRGDAVASMNLYGRDTGAMADLADHVRAAFSGAADPLPARPASGADDLAAGLTEALAVRDRIQRAIGMVVERDRCSPADAYLSLRLGAADAGVPLADMATRTVSGPR